MITLIVNPTAGSGYALTVADRLEQLLKQLKVDYRMLKPDCGLQTTAMARNAAQDDSTDAVISVGGDGTIFDVATGLYGSKKPLGIIPAGTGNDFIKSVGLPREPEEAMRFILSHQPRPVDIGAVNERFFMNVCGTGFDVTVLDYAEAAKKRFRGLTPYLIGLIKAIAHYKPVHIRMTVDGVTEEKDCLICSVANGRWIGGGIPICPVAKPNDGKLDLVLIDDVPRWKIPLYLPGLLKGKCLSFPFAKHVLCEKVELESKGMRINVDGDILPMDRVSFGILPGSLNLYW